MSYIRYNPDGVDYFFNLSESNRVALLNEMQNTAVGIVHHTLLEDLWKMKYEESKCFTGSRALNGLS